MHSEKEKEKKRTLYQQTESIYKLIRKVNVVVQVNHFSHQHKTKIFNYGTFCPVKASKSREQANDRDFPNSPGLTLIRTNDL